MIDDTSPADALERGVVDGSHDDPEEAQRKAAEAKDVKKWMDRIRETRDFDKSARIQYAKDRRYARGDSAFEVDANLIGTNIDILESFLYARDPDFDVTPGPSVRPPSVESLRDAVEDQMMQSPEVVMAGQQAAAMAVAMGTPPEMALQVGQQAEAAKVEELIRGEVERMLKGFRQRQREIKGFAETCEIVGTRMWMDASLKRRGRPWVRSALTIGVGWIMATWQERTAPSPETTQAINDLQDNIKRLESLKRQAAEGGLIDRTVGMIRSWVVDDDAKLADLRRQEQALLQPVEPELNRCFVVDGVPAEDMVVAPGYTIASYLDAPWMAHRVFMREEDALSEYALEESKLSAATFYKARKPKMVQRETLFAEENVDAAEADALFVKEGDYSDPGTGQEDADCKGARWVCVWEIWDRSSSTVLTGIEGLTCWVKPAWNPPATSRFYPFFLYATSEVDGQRHPQSLVTRSAKLVDEYNRIGSNEAEHRRRTLPKTMFASGQLAEGEAAKLQKGAIQEMIPIVTTNPNLPLQNLIQPVAYAGLDPALYDRTRITGEIERVWGIQEALSGSVDVAKTATEAEIQQQGFQARTSGRRDALETALGELALYTVELARAFLRDEDVRTIAGPDAFWPPYEGPKDLLKMLTVDIRAGSSGKPNTNAERQAWSALLPILQNGVVQIGQMRGASPAAIADSLEQLIRVTAERSGERMDIDQLIPQADMGMNPMAVPQIGGPAPGAPAPEPEPTGAELPPGGDPAADPLAA